MAASQTFTNLIRSIEASELNYTMTKTPFSATISLRSSFVKRHGEDSRCPESETFKHPSSEDLERVESVLNKAEIENLSLKAQPTNLEVSAQNDQDKFDKETLKLQRLYDTGKKSQKGLRRRLVN